MFMKTKEALEYFSEILADMPEEFEDDRQKLSEVVAMLEQAKAEGVNVTVEIKGGDEGC